jgi:hypothetical protein
MSKEKIQESIIKVIVGTLGTGLPKTFPVEIKNSY